jgi:hypothetical protein
LAYVPLDDIGQQSVLDAVRIAEISAELAHRMAQCGGGAKTASGALLPGQSVTLAAQRHHSYVS